MKKILFGIAIMLFGWIVEISLNLEMFALIVAAVGLILAIIGLADKEDK